MTERVTSIVDLSKLRIRDYPKCFLKRNPFPSIAIPEEIPPITVDRESIIRHFQDTIAYLYEKGESTVTVLVGEYGSGKSHLLRLFKHSVNSQLLHTEEPVLAVYIRSPGRNILDFFFAAVEDIGRSTLTQLSIQVIQKYLQKTWSHSKRHFFDKEIREKFEQGEIGIESLLRASTIYDLIREIREKLFSKIRNSDLVSAFLFLSHPDYSSIAWRWLLGEKLSREERDNILVDSLLTDVKESYSVLQSFIQLLQSLGMKALVFLVDELEKIMLIPSLQRSRYQDDLRHFIDDNPKGIAIFFAIAPAQWDMLSREPTALQRRLAGNVHVLDPFDEERIKDLIRGYLRLNRTEDYSETAARNRFPQCDPDLCPFTENSIDAILDKTKGIVSGVILLCRKSLDFFLDNIDSYEVITAELIELVAKQEGL